jgi:hypothetical protein
MFKQISFKKIINKPFPKGLKEAAIIRNVDFDPVIEDIKELGNYVNSILNTPPIVGPQGIQGPIGPQGVAGPVGPAGLTWKSSWNGTVVSYVKDDAVGFGGASWFCIADIAANVSNLDPSQDTTHWALLAAQGSQGPQGPQGIAGQSFNTFFIKSVDGVNVVGGGANFVGIAETIFIPANTLTVDCLLDLHIGILRNSGGVVQPRLYLNTVNSLIGATQIAAGLNISNDGFVSNLFRKFFLDVASQILKVSPDPLSTVSLTSVQNMQSIPFDPTINNYIIVASHHPNLATSSKFVYGVLNIY